MCTEAMQCSTGHLRDGELSHVSLEAARSILLRTLRLGGEERFQQSDIRENLQRVQLPERCGRRLGDDEPRARTVVA